MDKKILYKFFEGQATKKEKEAVRLWLKASPSNIKEFLRERKFFDTMILLKDPEERIDKKKKHSYLAWQELIKIAAIFILAIFSSVTLYKSEIKKIAAATNTVTVPAGQRVNLILPDSSIVWLNASSQISYPAAFTGNKREVSLNGEAYFEVKSDKERPFIVNTEKCIIKVRGTKFNVEAYDKSENFCTALMEGSVEVANKINPAKTIVLKPKHKVVLKDENLFTSAITDYDIYRWKEGLICFQNLNFNQLMSRFEKYYGIRINVQNKKLVNYICSGKFRVSDGIDNALRILQKDVKFAFDRDNNDTTIYIK